MEILGIGPMELLLLLIVALAVFGPDRLPQIGAKLGRTMRDMRRATRAISDEINSTRAAIEAPVKELAEPFKEVADAAKAVSTVAASARNPGQAIRESVLKEWNTAVGPGDAEATATAGENTIAPPTVAPAGVAPEGTADASAPTESAPMSHEAAGFEAALLETGEPMAGRPALEDLPAALPRPEAPIAALPAPAEPVAALPAPQETATPQESDPSAAAEEERPQTGPDSRAPGPPEQ